MNKNNKILLTSNSDKTILTIVIKIKQYLDWKEGNMMPLTMVKEGEQNTIKKVGGKEETRKFLENLGFVTGGVVTVISEIGGNMIVNVKDSRVAIGKDMANKIMV
jgi:ferrous iron transport protein A